MLAGLGWRRTAGARDQVFEGLVGTGRFVGLVRVDAERAQLAEFGLGGLHRLGVLVVVDDEFAALALGHLLDLRAGELAVEQDDAGAGLGGAVHRHQEPPVVAGQDRHAVTALDPLGEQAVGHCVGGVVEFLERHLTEVVDHRGRVGRPSSIECRDHPELAPPADIGDEGCDVLRGLQFQRPGGEHLAGVVQLGRTTLEVFADRLLGLGGGLRGDIAELRHAPTLCDDRRTAVWNIR